MNQAKLPSVVTRNTLLIESHITYREYSKFYGSRQDLVFGQGLEERTKVFSTGKGNTVK
jgi:hypothetical protein